jgi:rod shape determining protein RodA
LIALLRRPWTLVGVLSTLLLCAIAVENLAFTDTVLGTSYHRTQTIWLVLGLLGAGLVATVDLGFVRKLAPTLLWVLVALLVAVLFVGREINYSRRWIELGPLNLQPSEFTKLAVVLVLADWFDDRRAKAALGWRDLGFPLVVTLVPVVLINREPDLGTSLCVAFVALSVVLYHGVERKVWVAGALVLAVGAPLAWSAGVIRDYQKGRAEAWTKMLLDEEWAPPRTSEASQAELALWAVGSGRWSGRSDEATRASVLRHLPFVHTDFALAAFAERYGMLGCLLLFALYAGVVGWALKLADTADERFDALLAVGVGALIFWQFFINTGMVIGVLPVVGLTLPLLSYGGSSALTVLLGVGMVLNVALKKRVR